VTEYRVFLDLDVLEALRGIRINERRQLAALFEDLKVSPNLNGDLQETGSSGREKDQSRTDRACRRIHSMMVRTLTMK
jgi:hypothetical protein